MSWARKCNLWGQKTLHEWKDSCMGLYSKGQILSWCITSTSPADFLPKAGIIPSCSALQPKPTDPRFQVKKSSNYSILLFPPCFQTQDFTQSITWHRKCGLIWATLFSEPAKCFELNNQCCPSQLFPFQLINLNWPLSQQSFWLIFSLTTLSCRPVQHLRNVW